MGIKDRRRRRHFEASRYGDEETVSTESTLTADQTFSHVREHEGAVAFKGEQLMCLLTLALVPYEIFRATHDFPHSMALFYGLVSLLCTGAMAHYLLYKTRTVFWIASVLAATQAVAWLYIHFALRLRHFEPVCAFFWLLILGCLKVFAYVNERMGNMSEVMRR